MLKLHFSTPNMSARGSPLAHSVGEGLGVRAKKRARPAHSEPKRCTLISHTPTVRYNPDW
jgi:hypothetical protein